jgi:hypothetical protein
MIQFQTHKHKFTFIFVVLAKKNIEFDAFKNLHQQSSYQ